MWEVTSSAEAPNEERTHNSVVIDLSHYDVAVNQGVSSWCNG